MMTLTTTCAVALFLVLLAATRVEGACQNATISSGLGGTVQMSNFPSANYTKGDNCVWLFNFTDGTGRLQFTFDTRFSTAPNQDYLVFYDALVGTSDTLLAKWSGALNPDPLLTSAPFASVLFAPATSAYIGWSFNWTRVSSAEAATAGGGSVNMANGMDTMGCPGGLPLLANTKLDIGNFLTLEAWIKPSDLSASNYWYRMVHYRGTLIKYVLAINGGLTGTGMNQRNLVFTKCDTTFTANCGRVFNTMTDTIKVGVWQHVAVVYNFTTPYNTPVTNTGLGRWTVYINGIQMAYQEVTSGNTFGDPTFPPTQLGIASNPGSTVGAYKGSIDDLRIWSIAVNKTMINARMNGGLTGAEPGLVAWFKFDEPNSALYLNDSCTATLPPLSGCILGYGTGTTVPHRTLSTFPITGVCGNGFVEDGENCDDGNTVNGDCCSADCQTPAAPFTVCRASVGVCDITEYCIITGALSGRCPADTFNSTYVCRPSLGDKQCDPPEVCNGTGPVCPVDIKYSAGTACNDTNACSYSDQCQASFACSGTALSPVCGGNAYCSENSYASSTCVCSWGYVGDGYTCAVATCPVIASTASTTSGCSASTSAIGTTCTASCASGYAGTATTRTCTQASPGVAAAWTGSAPTCTATSCAALTSGTLYTSSCASGASVGVTCQRVCNSGYAGANTTHNCVQATVGAAAGFDSSATPTCAVTQCAAVAGTSSYTTTCSAATNVGGTCTLACGSGYAGSTLTRVCGQAPAGSAAAWSSTALPSCSVSVCSAILPGTGFNSACATSTTTAGSGCVLSCAAGYSGTSVTRNCQQTTAGASATFDSTSPPVCTATSCGALPSGSLYTSTCTNGAAVGTVCTRYCNAGYAASNTTHTCAQSSVGVAAAYDNSATPSCDATQCAGVGGTSSYTSSCPSSVNVGGTCTLACAAGYAGTALTRTCSQSPAGSTAGWSDTTTPTCSVSSCPAIPSGTGYSSACAAGTTAYLSYCTISCASSYSGTAVSPQCIQSSTGSPVVFSSTTPPTCAPTQCPALPATSSYDSACASVTTPVGSACVRSCARGYMGSATSSTCTQASAGATASFNPNLVPTCTVTTCPAVAATSAYTSSCASSTVNVDATCSLGCAAGYSGTPSVRTCQQTTTGGSASYDSSGAPSCAVTTCPPIPAGTAYTSSCSGGTTNFGGTCSLACAAGYAGSAVTRTCTQASAGTAGAFDSTLPPNCVATSCAAIANGASYSSGCASATTPYGLTCSLSCGAGYVGTAVTRTCQQSSTGAAATFDSTAPPSCVITTCPALAAGSLYASSCASGASVGTVCTRYCNSGYAGANTTHNCIQTSPGVAAVYDSSATPSCAVTQCAAIAGTTSYTSSCASAVNVGGTCTLACAAGYAGSSVTRTCGQAPLGAAAAWASNAVPSCSVSSCAAIASGTGYVSACATGTTAYLSSCTITCASGYAGTPVSPQCVQSSTGAPVTFTSTAPPTCTLTTCAAVASTASVISTCTSGSTSVGGTCTRSCAHGFSGTPTTDSCAQASTGVAAAFTPNIAPTCTVTTCSALAAGATYISNCSSSSTAVDSACLLSCATNYTGPSVVRTCLQTTVGGAAAFDSTLPPACMGAGCAVIPGGANYSSACNASTTAVGSSCIMSCLSGYAGATVTHSCTQAGVGANATFDAVDPPVCIPTVCAPIPSGTGYASTCAAVNTTVGGACSMSCLAGYTGSSVGPYTCQQSSTGSTAAFTATTAPTCVPTTCPALAAGAQYTSTCSGGSVSLGSTCLFTCSLGYTGTNITHTCQQSGAGAAGTWDSLTTPTCSVTSCAAISSTASMDSGCLGTTAVGFTCTLACAHAYTGVPVTRNCLQSPLGSPAAFDSVAPPVCLTTSCGPLVSDPTYASACSAGNTSVDATCARACKSGYAGAATLHTCQQTNVGALASWDTTSPPSCSVTTCASIPATGNYSSTCNSGVSNVGDSCTMVCKRGSTGAAVTRSCTQTAVGAVATWNISSVPVCLTTTCPVIISGSNFTSTCATTNTPVDGTCTLACGLGYTGTAVTRNCQQPVIGWPALFDSTSPPSCIIAVCLPLPSGATFNSACASANTVLGGTCTLTCASGYSGAAVTYSCTQNGAGATGNFSSTLPPACTPTMCAPISSAMGYVSACSAVNTTVGGTCSLSCAVGYAGSPVGPYTCVQTSVGAPATFSSTSAPSCVAATCPALGGGAQFTSNCANRVTALGATCTFTCGTGYTGANQTNTCTQSAAGAAGTWSSTAAPTCTVTSCAAIASATSYTSACASSTTAVLSTCALSCAATYAGTAVTHTCQQVPAGSVAAFESLSTPTCAVTTCAALPQDVTYKSSCVSNTTAVGSTCVRSCKTGYAGNTVVSTCRQTAVGAAASFDTTTAPTCVLSTCLAIPATSDYTSTCGTSASAVGDSCRMTCVSGKAGSAVTRACVQLSLGAVAAWNTSSLPVCVPTVCAAIPTGSTYTSACDSATTNVGGSCTISCAAGYTGSSVTRSCQQLTLGSLAAFDNTDGPSCAGSVCTSIPDGTGYDSACSGSTTGFGGTCVISCARGYAGTAVTRTCTQVGVGTSGVFDSTAPLSCTVTTCAAIASAASYVSSCTSATAVGGTCTISCAVGYTGTAVGPYACGQSSTGATAAFSSTTTPTCTAAVCVALPAGSQFTSTCGSGTTALGSSCTFTCSTGYAGASKIHSCMQTAAGLPGVWDATTTPSCSATRCAAITAGSTYTSACLGSTAVGGTCTMSCAHGYQGSAVTHACQQVPAGALAAFDALDPPVCALTTCATLGDYFSYTSSCLDSEVSVDGTCVRQCRRGYAGSDVTYTCLQSLVGAAADYDTTSTPSCLTTLCPSIPNTADYTSDCNGGDVNVDGSCTLTCAHGKAGVSVTRNCLQLSIGAPASWDSSLLPQCQVTTCPLVASGSTFDSDCNETANSVDTACTLSCAVGFTGASTVLNCQQVSIGGYSAFDHTDAPSCAGAVCASLPSGSTYDSQCNTATTAFGATCTLSCAHGYAGAPVTRTCIQTGTGSDGAFDSTAAPTCNPTRCGSIPSAGDGAYLSTCDSTITDVDGTCTLSCAVGLTGAQTGPLACYQAVIGAPATFEAGTAPTCVATVCPAMTSGSQYTSSCSGGFTPLGGTCTFTCSLGYAGPILTHTCMQVLGGDPGTWDSSLSPSCYVTSCPAIPGGIDYDTACTGTTAVGSTCTLSCAHGYAGLALTHTCGQPVDAAPALFDGLDTPSCLPTLCPSLPEDDSYSSTCVGATVSVDGTCVRECRPGYAGLAVTSTCVQLAVGAAALYDVTLPPICVSVTCPAIPATGGFLSTCTAGSIYVGGNCTLSCLGGKAGSTIVRYCTQVAPGVAAAWDPSSLPVCVDTVCDAIAAGPGFSSTCANGETSVDGTCLLACVTGYAGRSVTQTCKQSYIGALAAFTSTAAPLCTATTCSVLPANNTFLSTCASDPTSVGSTCTRDCRRGFAGASVVATCIQSTVGANASYSGASVPVCAVTTCPAVAATTGYTTTCTRVAAVDAVCTLACAVGYQGTTLVRNCLQAVTGAVAAWDDITLPSCILTQCPIIPATANFSSSCSVSLANVGASCTMTCALGFGGGSVVRTCGQAYNGSVAAWSGGVPDCFPLTCLAIPTDLTMLSACGTGLYGVGASCYLVCQTGYLGGNATRVCTVNPTTNTAAWSGASPSCAAASCPVIVDTSSTVSTCGTATASIGASCAVTCKPGYVGLARVAQCAQASIGLPGDWNAALAATTCVLGKCSTLSAGAKYSSSCEATTTLMGNTCTLACLPGTVGMATTVHCVADDTWDALFTPECEDCRSCAPGEWEVTSCSTAAHPTCSSCSVCPTGQYIGAACNVSTDTVCNQCSECPEAYYVSVPCSNTTDTQCERRSCDPLVLASGFVTGSNITVGGTVVFTCQQGFVLAGATSATCQSDGQWDQTTPVCIDASAAGGVGAQQGLDGLNANKVHDYTLFAGLAVAAAIIFLIGCCYNMSNFLRDHRARELREGLDLIVTAGHDKPAPEKTVRKTDPLAAITPPSKARATGGASSKLSSRDASAKDESRKPEPAAKKGAGGGGARNSLKPEAAKKGSSKKGSYKEETDVHDFLDDSTANRDAPSLHPANNSSETTRGAGGLMAKEEKKRGKGSSGGRNSSPGKAAARQDPKSGGGGGLRPFREEVPGLVLTAAGPSGQMGNSNIRTVNLDDSTSDAYNAPMHPAADMSISKSRSRDNSPKRPTHDEEVLPAVAHAIARGERPPAPTTAPPPPISPRGRAFGGISSPPISGAGAKHSSARPVSTTMDAPGTVHASPISDAADPGTASAKKPASIATPGGNRKLQTHYLA